MWENVDKSRPDSAHYAIMRKRSTVPGMDALRGMFPEGTADELNFVLFSTSGVHGTYLRIEEAEEYLKTGEGFGEVTFVVVHPRLVAMRYGTCDPQNQDDIDFLKRLRESSHKIVAAIGTQA